MPFSHKPRPGFELHFIPPPGCRRLSSGKPQRPTLRPAVRGALALAFAVLPALAWLVRCACAEPASTAVPGGVAQVAPAAGDPGSTLTASGAATDDSAVPPAAPTYTGPARA